MCFPLCKTSVLEAAILQAIQAVSKYVLENEDEFIQQLKAVWNEQQTRTANNGYQELAEAKKRMTELDEKINKLYESTLSGLLPERQAQRMIQQYDEEQILLERRVAELEIWFSRTKSSRWTHPDLSLWSRNTETAKN